MSQLLLAGAFFITTYTMQAMLSTVRIMYNYYDTKYIDG